MLARLLGAWMALVLLPGPMLGACGEAEMLAEIKGMKDLRALDADGRTPLLRAIRLGYPEAVRALLERGADADQPGADGMTPLIAAAFKDHPEVYRLVLRRRPKLDAQDRNGWTALMALAWRGSQMEAEELLMMGATPEQQDALGETAYIKARQRGFFELAQALTLHGAEARKPRVPVSPYAVTGLSQDRRWALALAAILLLRNGLSTDVLGGGPPEIGNEHAQTLKAWWGIGDRDEALSTLRRLRDEGQRAQYDAFRRIFDVEPDKSDESLQSELGLDEEGLAKARFVRKERERLGRRGILAWDLGRLVFVADLCYLSGYLSEEEAWDWIMPAAVRVQEAYASWADFAGNYMDGRSFSGLDPVSSLHAVKELLLDPSAGGPWNELPWDAPLNRPGKRGPALAGDRVPPFPTQGVEDLRKDALDGCSWARYELARRYQEGEIVLGIGQETVRYYMADAAAEGYPWAHLAMGRHYWKPESMKRSLAAYSKAADAGLSEAKAMVANFYLSGDGRPKDLKKALALFREAAEAGDIGAATMVGDFYRHGYGIAADPAEGARWYERAAALGEPRAAVQLADMLTSGLGVHRDRDKAAYWLRRAVLRREPGAQTKLDALLKATPAPAPAPASRPGEEALLAPGSYRSGGPALRIKWLKDLRESLAAKDPELRGPYAPFGCREDVAERTIESCRGTESLGGDILMATDGQYLQFKLHVVQGRPPKNPHEGKDLHRGDAVHIWLREKPALSDRASGGAYTRLDHHIIMAPSEKAGSGKVWSEDRLHQRAMVVSVPQKDGYLITLMLPASDMGLTGLKTGDRLRFDVGVSVPGKDGRLRWGRWRGRTDSAEDPDTWGIAELR